MKRKIINAKRPVSKKSPELVRFNSICKQSNELGIKSYSKNHCNSCNILEKVIVEKDNEIKFLRKALLTSLAAKENCTSHESDQDGNSSNNDQNFIEESESLDLDSIERCALKVNYYYLTSILV